MNINLRGEVLIKNEKPAEYMQATDSNGVVQPAVQVAPAEYAVYNTVPPVAKKTPWALLVAAVAGWFYFK